jgi:diguanylate cyclase (GGDEF)-like protein
MMPKSLTIATEINRIVRRDRQLWWIAVLVIAALTATIVVIYSPELIGVAKKDVTFQLKTYLLGLSFLILLFCLYVLQTSFNLEKLNSELLQKEIENDEAQLVLEQVQERSKELLKTKEALEKEILERKQAEDRLTYMALHDDLTDLPNRTLLIDRLSQILTRVQWRNRLTAVLSFDLDHFNQINDTMGHQTGNLLLKAVSERFRTCVRPGDTIARLGGDEFVMVLADLARVEDVSKIAQKVIEAFSKPFAIQTHEFYVTTSIGISLSPNDGVDSQTLLRAADMAMFRAKEQGRNNYQFYHPALNSNAHERFSLETGLRQALVREEFLLHYQPQVDLGTGQIIGVEALLRWKHPDRGLVSPAKFIPLAEDTGLIVPIGEWVLRTACAQAKSWQTSGFDDIKITVNLSGRQFQQNNLIETIREILRETGLDHRCLELELTESVMQNSETTIAMLRELTRMGIDISIDDFGTGYSSLSYLKRFPIRTLKIDQSFVRNVTTNADDPTIIKAIISLAHSLRLRAIAEGVETEEQLQFLRSLECDGMQGFLLSPPLPADEMIKFLVDNRSLYA